MKPPTPPRSPAYVLRPGTLEVHGSTGFGVSGIRRAIALDRVRRVTLVRQFGGRVTCTVEPQGEPGITISSTGRPRCLSEHGAVGFAALVRELHCRLLPHRQGVQFTRGSPGWRALLRGCGLVAVMVAVALVLGSGDGGAEAVVAGLSPTHAAVLGLLLVGIPLCRLGPTVAYDPAELPFDLAETAASNPEHAAPHRMGRGIGPGIGTV